MDYQIESEFSALLNDYRSLERRKYVLEIGSMMGETLEHWFDAGDDGMKLISIDLIVPPSDDRHRRQTDAHEFWKSWSGKDGKTVTVHNAISQGEAAIRAVREAVPCLDFLFIDGGHDYATVHADYYNYAPLVRPGGLIAFHDISGIPDVRRLWNEVRGHGNAWEHAEPGGMGIGVLRKPDVRPKLHVITRYSRPGVNALENIAMSLEPGREFFDIRWWIAADGRMTNGTSDQFNTEIETDFTTYGGETCFGGGIANGLINDTLDRISDGWIWVLDDDNLAHPEFFIELHRSITSVGVNVHAFAQKIHGGIRTVHPHTVKETLIDQAQFVMSRSFIGDERYLHRYCADGEFAERMHKKHPEQWTFCNTVCTLYNAQRK